MATTYAEVLGNIFAAFVAEVCIGALGKPARWQDTTRNIAESEQLHGCLSRHWAVVHNDIDLAYYSA
jgi:hypothetical protein